jgi:hypothetical protein
MKKFLIDSLASLFIILLFLPLLCLSIVVTIWEFTFTFPKNITEVVNVYYDRNGKENTQV